MLTPARRQLAEQQLLLVNRETERELHRPLADVRQLRQRLTAPGQWLSHTVNTHKRLDYRRVNYNNLTDVTVTNNLTCTLTVSTASMGAAVGSVQPPVLLFGLTWPQLSLARHDFQPGTT